MVTSPHEHPGLRRIYDAKPELCCCSDADCMDDHELLDWPDSDFALGEEEIMSRMIELISDLLDDESDLTLDDGDPEADARDDEIEDGVEPPEDQDFDEGDAPGEEDMHHLQHGNTLTRPQASAVA